jgi:hypothetical protein
MTRPGCAMAVLSAVLIKAAISLFDSSLPGIIGG